MVEFYAKQTADFGCALSPRPSAQAEHVPACPLQIIAVLSRDQQQLHEQQFKNGQLYVPADKLTWCKHLLVRAEALALSLSKGLLAGSMQLPHVPITNRHRQLCLSLIQQSGVMTSVYRVLR
ncbi:hypothetical protein ABBQ32_010562 [Trebouxia sp. C0010 RCD-2024]